MGGDPVHNHYTQLNGSDFGLHFETQELQSYDALGNMVSAQTSTSDGAAGSGYLWSASFSDWQSIPRTASYDPVSGRLMADNSAFGTSTYTYDAAGNTTFMEGEAAPAGGPAEDRASYYDASDRLRAQDYRWKEQANAFTTGTRRVFEEFRYDALGRRVLVESRRTCSNVAQAQLGACHESFVRRTVWDGDQKLDEIQQPVSMAENDTALVILPTADTLGFNDQEPYYGIVAYSYAPGALGVDQPISIVRLRYIDQPFGSPSFHWNSFSISPLWDMCGRAGSSVTSDNINVSDIGGLATCINTGPGSAYRCTQVQWPDGWFAYTRPRFVRSGWMGSLAEDGQDQTGTLDRRSRAYDPRTGRFTQEDPIGLAGGLNAYGFAAGDPVTYSDPFGLCPAKTLAEVPLCLGQTLAPFQDLVENKIAAPITQTGKDASEAIDNIRSGHSVKGTLQLALALGLVAGPEEEGGRLALSEGEEVIFSGRKISNSIASDLGLARRELGNRIEAIKKAAGLGGRENVIITNQGNVFSRATKEFLDNVHDVFPIK